ncbi:MAG TPA: hypothetical protein VEC11_13180 [Allosphingosinicella sp.]|nr:hypothetical protein [Allosphingosinicella sp.]
MLALDDPRWNALHHAYGAASDIPDLLRALEASPGPTGDFEDEPWSSLWSALSHQDDAYTASYATVPHVIRIALAARGPIDFSFLLFPTSVEIARKTGHAPELPPELADAYLGAIAGLVEVASRHGSSADEAMQVSVAAALAVAEGDVEAAQALLDRDEV